VTYGTSHDRVFLEGSIGGVGCFHWVHPLSRRFCRRCLSTFNTAGFRKVASSVRPPERQLFGLIARHIVPAISGANAQRNGSITIPNDP
jgi:hypothetical protein